MKQWLIRYSLTAGLPVALTVLAFGACSSERDAETSQRDPALTVSESGVELAESVPAKDRLQRLRQQFVRMPREPRSPEFKPAKGLLPPHPRPAAPEIAPRSVFESSAGVRFIKEGTRVRTEIAAAERRDARMAARVELPQRAQGRVRLEPENASFGIEFAASDLERDVELEVSDGTAIYAGAGPGGGDMLLRVTAEGVEDFIVLPQKLEREQLDYSVNV